MRETARSLLRRWAAHTLRVLHRDRRLVAAEFLTRANYALPLGNFEMDFEDGEVRFKNSIDFEGETLTDALIHNTLYPATSVATRYFPGLLRVVFGDLNPRDVIREIES